MATPSNKSTKPKAFSKFSIPNRSVIITDRNVTKAPSTNVRIVKQAASDRKSVQIAKSPIAMKNEIKDFYICEFYNYVIFDYP